MVILKFLHGICDGLKDITNDSRTNLIPINSMINNKYQISPNVYMVRNSFMIKMAKLRGEKTIQALRIRSSNNTIIIIDETAYVFWDGRSIEPEIFGILKDTMSHKMEELEKMERVKG